MRTRTAAWFRVLAVTALLSAACGSTTGNATPRSTAEFNSTPNPSPISTSPSPTSTPSAAQQLQCQVPSNRCLVLVTLKGSDNVVVRDVTDINHPRTVGNL